MALGIQETSINRTAGHSYGDYCFPLEDSILDGTMPNLYRYGVKEHGRCTGKVYVDTDDGVKHIGYVFLKRRQYEDSDKSYLAETWVTIGEYHPRVEEHITYGS
jgi:hypothetical protein